MFYYWRDIAHTAIGIVAGIIIAFGLFGLQILPTITLTNPYQEVDIPVIQYKKLEVLIRLPSDRYYFVYEYELGEGVWYLYDYVIYDNGELFEPKHTPLTIGINESCTIIKFETNPPAPPQGRGQTK